MAIPACFVLSKILVPETEIPLTADGVPDERAMATLQADGMNQSETVAGEPIERTSPMDAAIVGALDGVKMAVAIAAVLIVILGLVSLINQFFGWLGNLPAPIGGVFQVITLQNLLGALFLPLTVLTGVSLEWNELWQSSVIIGRRLFETAIPPYQALAAAVQTGELDNRALLIVSYALSGFAHIPSVGIFVGGTTALAPSRRKDIADLGWKALLIGTLATLMIACVAGVFDTGSTSILGTPTPPAETVPSPTASPSPAPAVPAPSPRP
ncbi:nucleoside transporter C-terminal domain-containing protein, partial [Leptolyngbya sp. FACHB-711]